MENSFFIDLLQTIRTSQLVTILVLFLTDFFTGIIGSKIQGKEVESKKWINGVLRKSQIFLMLFCIGLISTLLHFSLLYECFYWLFLLGEVKSIFENGVHMNIPYAKEISNLIDVCSSCLIKKISSFTERFK